MNRNDLEQLKKALDVASAGGALQQPLVDQVLQELIEVNNPLRKNLPRKPGSGSDWILNQRTARGVAGFVNDTETPASSNSAYAQKKFPFKSILQPGKITRRLQAQGKTLLDIQAEEVDSALQAVRDTEENALINGDASGNPKEFDGLRNLIPAGQIFDAGVQPLTLDRLDEAIDLNRGIANMLIMSKKANRKLNALIQTQQRFVDTTEVAGGFRVQIYNGLPIFRSIFVSDVQGVGNNETDIFILDTTGVWVGELTALKMEPLAKKSSQFEEFDIFEDITLVLGNDLKASRLSGITL